MMSVDENSIVCKRQMRTIPSFPQKTERDIIHPTFLIFLPPRRESVLWGLVIFQFDHHMKIIHIIENCGFLSSNEIVLDQPSRRSNQEEGERFSRRNGITVCPIVEDDPEDETSCSATSSTTPPSTAICLNEQQSFLLRLKIFMLYIARVKETVLQRRVQAFVNHCTAENRRGNPNYQPLLPVLEQKLPKLIGAMHWDKTTCVLHKYCESRNIVLYDDS